MADEVEEPEDAAAMEMRKKIFAIIRDPTMTVAQKAKAQQALMTGVKWTAPAEISPGMHASLLPGFTASGCLVCV